MIGERRTEFRVWNGDDEKMIYGDPMDNALGLDNTAGEVYIWGTKETEEGIEFTTVEDQVGMQYTNFDDKNDTKIFEGDIVSAYVPQRGKYWVVMFHPKYKAWSLTKISDYLKDESTEGWGSSGGVKFYHINRRGIEVLGNVFQNKDLLEKHG